MRKRFDYRKIPDYTLPRRQWVKRPMLQVTLFNGERRQTVISLVDSGADDCLFHSSIGDRLGIDVESGQLKSYEGIAEGHPIDAYLHIIELQVQDFSERISIQAGFTHAEGVHGLLGQAGFFQNYRIIFERYRGCLWVENYQPTVAGR